MKYGTINVKKSYQDLSINIIQNKITLNKERKKEMIKKKKKKVIEKLTKQSSSIVKMYFFLETM